MTTLYFIRHAESDTSVTDDRTRPLTVKGHTDCALVADYLSDKIIDAIYSSPYKRAVDTISVYDDNDLDGYMLGHHVPHFRKDLLFIAKADNGDYCAYGLIWIDEVNKYAYLEPLSTVPQYRRKGLAKALIYEAINRTSELGTTYMVGGSGDFYKGIGFETQYAIQYYKKVWS